jgi:hypothetical protein
MRNVGEEQSAWECPVCGRPLDEAGLEWLGVLLRETPPGDMDFAEPDVWQKLSCGHRVEAIIDRTNPDAPNIRLRPYG